MSTPFTTEDLETLDQWNSVLAAGCCCAMPACPIPLKVCESLTRTSTSEDDDYTDSRAAYLERLSAWKSELLNAWYAERDAWMAEDPERELEDYPEDPPTPRLDAGFSEYPGPTMPAGYLDGPRGSFAPYARPAGDPDDEVPSLYRMYVVVSATTKYTGTASLYTTGFEGSDPYELLVTYTYANTEIPEGFSGVRTGNKIVGGICDSYTFGPPPGFVLASVLAEYATYVDGPELLTCLEASRTFSTTSTLDVAGRSTLVGCPGTFDGPEEVFVDLTKVYSYGHTLSEPVTKTALGTRASGKIPAEWPEEAEGVNCIAKLSFIWPVIRDGFIGADPEVDPPEEGEWRTCAEYLGGEPFELYGWATAIKNRFRWRVPSLIIYRADPDVPLDPDAEPVPDDGFPDPPPDADLDPDPVDWWRGTYFKVVWQTCFFSIEWTAWKLLWDAYEAAKELHDQWVTDGSVVPELPALPPEEPTHPGLQPTPPTLGEDQEDVWTGPGDPNDDDSWLFPGGWHEIATPATAGETRVVNVRFYCYPASPYGYLPQVTGEKYEAFTVPDPPET